MTYRVLILEDDPMVAAIDRQYVESDRRFQVVQVCKSGGQALEYLAKQDVELIVLDYYTPEMNGQEFLDRLHTMGRAPAVIMATSASDTDIVRSLLSRGVQDYLSSLLSLSGSGRPGQVSPAAEAAVQFGRDGPEGHRPAAPVPGRRGGSTSAEQRAQWGHPAPHPGFPGPQPGAGPHQRGDRRAGTPVPNHHPPLCQLHGGSGGDHQLHRLPDRRPPSIRYLRLHS